MRFCFPLPPRDEQTPLGWCRRCGEALYPGDRAALRDGGLLCQSCAPEELPLRDAEGYVPPPAGSFLPIHFCGSAPRKRS